MLGDKKNCTLAYEILSCEALRAMKTGTEHFQVQISDISGNGGKN